jgi:hypothetical protein
VTLTGPADLVVLGRIATLAGPAGAGWASAIAILGGRVAAAGSAAEIEGLIGHGTRRLRLAPDEVALPGITDAHLHLVDAALAETQVDLEGCASPEDVAARVRAHMSREVDAPRDRWLLGAGWDVGRLGRWPTADDLDLAAPGRLVALWAHDHHSLLASGRALAEAGIDDARTDPDGGLIRRDGDGRPTGVLHERAASLVADRVPAPTTEDVLAAVLPYARRLLALGVTGVHDPGGLAAVDGLGPGIATYRHLAARGELPLRVHASVRPEQLAAAREAGLRSGGTLGDDPRDRLRMGWLKLFADGTLGSRTAALLEPFERVAGETPAPNERLGVWVTPPDELTALAAEAARCGIATQVHAIGDAAVRAALEALAPTAGVTPLMPRVEHVQLVADADLARFSGLGVAASMQPIHVRSDVDAARRLWGDRAETRAYALEAIERTGAVLASGTDAPVEPPDPWPGIACAVTRAAPSWPPGTAALGRANGLGLWSAIRAACLGPARCAGETDRGRLVAGHRADLVIVPAAAVSEPVEVDGALWHARPRVVLVDGEIVAGAG